MKTWKELLAEARKAIEDGDLEKARELKARAAELKEIEALDTEDEEPTPVTETEEYKALQDEVDELKAFKEKIENEPATNGKGGTVVVTEAEEDKKAEKPFKSLGEFIHQVYIAAVQPHRIDDRLKKQKALGASEGVPADGGFFVQTDHSQNLFQLAHDMGELMQRVRSIPIGANSNGLTMNAIDETSRATGSRFGGIQGYWVAEGNTITTSKPTFRQMELRLNKLAAAMYATDELLADTTALGAVAEQAVSEEIMWLTEDSYLNGTGSGQPKGILNSNALVTISKETGQDANTIVAQNIFKMWSRMWSRSRRNAVWFINQDIEPQLFGLELPIGTGGVPVYLPPGGLSESPYGRLMGRPVIPIEYSATLGTVGDIMLLDLSQYLTIDKGDVESAESIHVQFLTDEMTFRWIYRIDGQPAWRSALTPANGSNTQSPFIALATRS